MRPDSNPAAIQVSDSPAMRSRPVCFRSRGTLPIIRSHTGNAIIDPESNADPPSPIAAVWPVGNADLAQAQQPQQHSIFDPFANHLGHWDKPDTHQKVVEEME